MASASAATRGDSRTRTAVLLAAGAVLTMLVLATIDHDGPAWFIQPVLGAAAAVTAYRAGATARGNAPALAALVVGVVMVLVFLGFVIAGE